MANVNAPFGLRPMRNASGTPYNGACKTFYLPTGEANDIFIGDPVYIAGSADTDGVPTCTLATAGATNKISGVVVGFVPSPGIITYGYRKASTAEYVLVCTDPDIEYEVQTTTLAAADLEANSILASGSGNAYSRLSGWYVDTGTKGTSATYQVRIVGVSQRPDNVLGQYCVARVRINLHTELALPDGVGV